ncbi:MAG: permease-like cell division protein FtsX [Flammeovirgaceae bacterium]|nr:permease-like cell division protein FtsX [Flammeovirgaceae bacterium]
MGSKVKYQAKKQVGSYPFINVLVSISTALFMIGLFCLLVILANNLTYNLKKDIEIQVFLKSELTNEERSELVNQLQSKEYILKNDGKAAVRYLSKENAAKQLIEDTGEDFIEFLGENPLRDSYIIILSQTYQTNENMDFVKLDLESHSQVFEVAFTRNLKELILSINDNIKRVGLILVILVGMLLFTVVILINNAIKLALFSQRFLIRSMQLVGATPYFIKKPFLLRAILQGCLGGGIAIAFLSILLFLTKPFLDGFESNLNLIEISIVFLSIIIIGISISYFSAYSAVSKYLKLKLDELY